MKIILLAVLFLMLLLKTVSLAAFIFTSLSLKGLRLEYVAIYIVSTITIGALWYALYLFYNFMMLAASS